MTLSEIGEIPSKLLIYIAKQLDIDAEKFYLYGRRENTI